ncbi:MFS transporter [Paenibacillus thailandensis]|uniref:MFS transporter n=1 Tax=Paenibacillus thailandensis TaxID=393250 RepID=A0ABW5QTR6_9BACL
MKSWPPNIRLFFVANLLYQIGSGMFSVLYNLYIQELGYGGGMNGTIIGMQSLATAICFIPIGLIGDKLNRKLLLVLGALLSGLIFAGRSFYEAENGLLALAVLSGLFASIFQVLAIPFLAENSDTAQRLKIFSLFSSLVLAAQVLGSFGGGVLADLLQAMGISSKLSLQLALLAGSLATLAAFLPLLFMREQAKPAETGGMKPVRSEHRAEQADRDARRSDFKFIAQFVAVQLQIGFGSGLVIPYLNLYFTNRFDVSLSGMSLLISLGQIMTIVSMLIGPALVAKVGQVKAIVIFQTLSLPFLLLTGFTNLLLVASVSFLFRQALMNAANPIQSSLLVDRVSDKRRGIANSCNQTAFMLGWATMGPVQAHLVTAYGYYWGYAITFSITGILYVSASMIFFAVFREKRSLASERALNG